MKIEITVTPDGSSRVETKGFVGSTCRDASRFLELALGKQSSEQLKPEFYESVPAQQQAKQGH